MILWARSLGLAVQVSAQSWQGLAPDDDDRYRLAATADGGIWLLRTPHPEPVTALAGERKLTDTSRRLLGAGVWNHEGSSRIQLVPVADPALIRGLDVGQAAYIYRGGVTFVQVKRVIGGPAALAAAPVAPPAADGRDPAAQRSSVTEAPRPAPRSTDPPPRPDAGGFLDEAFGVEAGR